MLQIFLRYTKDNYDIFNIEDGYIVLEETKYFPTIEYNKNFNLFTFIIDKENTYTIKINLDNKFYDCFTQPLYLNNELIDPLKYQIHFEENEIYVSSEDEEDFYG